MDRRLKKRHCREGLRFCEFIQEGTFVCNIVCTGWVGHLFRKLCCVASGMLRRQAGNDRGYELQRNQVNQSAMYYKVINAAAVECRSTLSRLSSLHFSSPGPMQGR